VFIVIPQFLVTALASLIFAIFEPDKSVLHGHHPATGQPVHTPPPANSTISPSAADLAFLEDPELGMRSVGVFVREVFSGGLEGLRKRAEEERDDGTNSVAIIFRVGGVAALVAFVLTYRLSRDLRRKAISAG
jgi:solute carrier family 45 protein 1/2/4